MPTIPHLLVIANRTCPCPGLAAEVATLAAGGEVLVVAPALNSRLRHYLSDTDAALVAAADRLMVLLGLLADAGVSATGEVGDADPLVAVADALHAFPASAVLISTLPAPRSHWLERRLPERLVDRFGLPVHHHVSAYGLQAGVASGS